MSEPQVQAGTSVEPGSNKRSIVNYSEYWQLTLRSLVRAFAPASFQVNVNAYWLQYGHYNLKFVGPRDRVGRAAHSSSASRFPTADRPDPVAEPRGSCCVRWVR
jgi:hypothetical protein